MNTFALSLFFLSPLISYATYILLQENRDPLRGFHDSFLKNSRNYPLESDGLNTLNSSESKVLGRNIPGSKVLISLFLIALPILFFAGIPMRLILILGISIPAYIFWLKESSTREAKKELQCIESEFPAIVELFAVLVSAGESPSMALQRVSERAAGVLAEKLKETLSKLQQGRNLTQALEQLGLEVNSATIRRFCDTLILAIERGTTLSDVLTRQVEEVRVAHHASLMIAAGKAEIALMIPVIFLILPISVLFALWPSYLSLGQSVM